jgi:hypothetical protein
MSYTVDGQQRFESTGEKNRRQAQQKLDIRRAEVAQGRFDLLKRSPTLGEWSKKYLGRVSHDNTRRRYSSSRENLIALFEEGTLLTHISTARIEAFIRSRREQKVKAATINRDLRFLAQILKQAERERYLGRSPFDLGKFFQNESKERRKPIYFDLGGAGEIVGRCSAAYPSPYGLRNRVWYANKRDAWASLARYRFSPGHSASGEEQDTVGNSDCSNFSVLQSGTTQVAQSDWSRTFRMGLSQFYE